MKTNLFILILIISHSLLFGQAPIAYNKPTYDSLLIVGTKKSFYSPDKKNPIKVIWIEKTKKKDSLIINKTTCNITFLDYIKRKNKVVYCVYRKKVYYSVVLEIGKKKQKLVDVIDDDHVFLADSTGDEVAYVFGYGKDLYIGTENDSLMLFQYKKVSDKIISIDPLSQNLEVQAKDKENLMYMWVRLLFYEDKTKTKVTLFPKH